MRQFGAREFDLDIDTGTGYLLPPEGQAFRVEELEEAVEHAGFELLGVESHVRGRLGHARGLDGAEIPAVKVESTGQSFVLIEGDSDRAHEAWARLSPNLEHPNSSISVRGRVHRHEAGPTGLVVNDSRMLDG
ncbi:MAG: hypothetical protein E2O39_13340 [Planctomycetota bacterium]|nr:MAG: hypothetical protein E2O39_13340 [Planctomycetota bacterium]